LVDTRGAVAVHICIGSVYAWVHQSPVQELFAGVGWFNPIYGTYSTALVLLGLSAAFGGPWVGAGAPGRRDGAAIFFGSGVDARGWDSQSSRRPWCSLAWV
jgi:hypothetical protein